MVIVLVVIQVSESSGDGGSCKGKCKGKAFSTLEGFRVISIF